MVAATFRHDTSRNLDPQLHSHAVIANMVQGEDGKWRTMANEKLYESKMLIGAIYRSEFARGLGRIGYRVEKTHADGRFEIAGVPRPVVEAFSTRRAAKRDIDRDELTAVWQRQAADLGFDARALTAEAAKGAERESAGGEGRQVRRSRPRRHRKPGSGAWTATRRGAAANTCWRTARTWRRPAAIGARTVSRNRAHTPLERWARTGDQVRFPRTRAQPR